MSMDFFWFEGIGIMRIEDKLPSILHHPIFDNEDERKDPYLYCKALEKALKKNDRNLSRKVVFACGEAKKDEKEVDAPGGIMYLPKITQDALGISNKEAIDLVRKAILSIAKDPSFTLDECKLEKFIEENVKSFYSEGVFC